MRLRDRIAERLSLPGLAAGLAIRALGDPGDLTEQQVVYGPDPHQYVLVVRPRPVRAGTPLVYFLHGGSWRNGSPATFRAIGRFFARHGYVAALGGYRLVPQARFPAQRDDALAGLAAALREHRASGAGDGPLLIAGQSAGAQLAALVAFDLASRGAAGLSESAISGVLLVSGPLDFDVMCPGRTACPLIEALLGGTDGWEQADPARFAHAGPRIPVLCLHGSRDTLVPSKVAASFVMRANGSESDHATFAADPAAHHSDMTRLFFGTSPLTPTMLDWMAEAVRTRP